MTETAAAAHADGEVVEYWIVDNSLIDSYPQGVITRCRATYHANTPWADHPWGRVGSILGANFEDDWSIERWDRSLGCFSPSGRSCGADWIDGVLRRSEVFTSEAAAAKSTLFIIEQHIERCINTLDQLRRTLADMHALAAGSRDAVVTPGVREQG